MKLKSKGVAILVLVVLFGGILASNLLGLWQTESRKIPARIEEGEFAGAADPSDIRGSYTFGDIERSFPITVEILADAFSVVENPADFQLKSLEAMYPSDGEFELGTASVRYFVARYTGLPYVQTGEEALFPKAVQILKQEEKITEEEARSIPIMNPEISISYEKNQEEASSEDHVEPLVKGNTTIADLFALGLDEAQIVEVTGDYESKGELVRDVCKANGIPFSSAKEILVEMADQ